LLRPGLPLSARAVQRYRDRPVNDHRYDAAAIASAENWNEFGALPWVSHIRDHALGQWGAADSVDLHVEALGL